MIKAFAPMMISARFGHIVKISSIASKNALPNGAAYAASKWGLNGLTYSVARSYGTTTFAYRWCVQDRGTPGGRTITQRTREDAAPGGDRPRGRNADDASTAILY